MKRFVWLLIASVGVLSWGSVPTISNVTAQLRYPWNEKVDITVMFTGASNDVAKAACTFAATNSATQAALTVKTATETGTGPVAAIPTTRGDSIAIRVTVIGTTATTATLDVQFVPFENLPASARITRVSDSF